MSRDKYISKKNFVSGFSFANLGAFSGFGNGIIGSVYALVLMDIFKSSAMVGLYAAAYSLFCLFIALFAEEFFRSFSKSKLFYGSMILIAIMYFMMAFPIKAASFIALDFASGIPLILVSLLIPLFMNDFSKKIGMARLNGRYQFWINLGALISPMIAMFLAGQFGNRSAFFAISFIYFFGAALFNFFGVIQQDKKIRKFNAKKAIKLLIKNTALYFKRPKLVRAYMVNFGFSFQGAMRMLYVPIIIISQGFSKEVLGLVLMLGIVPYVLLAQPMAKISKKYGISKVLSIGFISFSVLSIMAAFASGYILLAIFVLWQIPGAIIASVRDLLFFDATTRQEESKFIGVFKTNINITKILAPLLGAAIITVFGFNSAVWIATAVVSMISVLFLPKKSK